MRPQPRVTSRLRRRALTRTPARLKRRNFQLRRLHPPLSRILHTCELAHAPRPPRRVLTCDTLPFMSPSAFPDAMALGERSESGGARSETPMGDGPPTPRDQEEKKEGHNDSEGMFELDS